MKKSFLLCVLFSLFLMVSAKAFSFDGCYSIGGDVKNPVVVKVKVPKPTVTSHVNKQEVGKAVVFAGTALPNNQVELQILLVYKGGEKDFGTYILKVDKSGKWTSENIALWVPKDVEKPKYKISAVQVDEAKNRSKPMKFVVFPKDEVLIIPDDMLDGVILQMPPPKVRGEVIVKSRWGESLNNFDAPEIISPHHGSILSGNQKVQLIGKGVPGSKITVQADLTYQVNTDYYSHEFELSAKVNAEGIWVTESVYPDFPEQAKEIEYLFQVIQISKEGVEANPETLMIKQKL